MNTTCNHALFALLEIFNMFYSDLKDIVLEDLLDRIHWCTLQGIGCAYVCVKAGVLNPRRLLATAPDNEVLGRSASQSMQVLLLTNGKRFTPAMWDMAIATVHKIFRDSTPQVLFQYTPGTPVGNVCRCCSVQY